eukprot:TRINITY_DN39284_c0_g1_i1.p1 TRINITY_DN39284_c0_g1~~TRINITY_DN39284_c0_g1_i1.p1  ORF type:complete len:163 (+),score=26.94 TRINITY_DN39284_c0_g1_i1:136-624(+)
MAQPGSPIAGFSPVSADLRVQLIKLAQAYQLDPVEKLSLADELQRLEEGSKNRPALLIQTLENVKIFDSGSQSTVLDECLLVALPPYAKTLANLQQAPQNYSLEISKARSAIERVAVDAGNFLGVNASLDLPLGWESGWSEEHNCRYYFNRGRGLTTWAKPV